ncbi:MAG: putative Fe-S cluster assembly protein SufT [Acidimicrobiales bacterium]
MSPGRPEPIELRRDCRAILIPSGDPVVLRHGDRVTLFQSLGGSYTVQTVRGELARLAAGDVDALDLEDTAAAPEATACHEEGPGAFEFESVIEQLKTVFDPEIPINVVDLGLVYECEARPLPLGGQRVEIKMSMTAPGCGMGDVLREDARSKVLSVPGVTDVDVELVWDPPWDMSRLSEAARLELGLF